MEGSVIVDVEATPTRISKEVDATETMIDRTKERFALKPKHIAGDVTYGTGEMLGKLVARDIDPHIPVWDKSNLDDGTFSRADFIYDEARDLYTCPGAKHLKTTGRLHSDNTYRYIVSKYDCDACALKPKCCPNMPARRIPRDPNEAARDYTRALMETEAYADPSADRKKIEALFGEAKHILSMVRLRLRGLTGARDEFLLTGHRPEPQTAGGARHQSAAKADNGLIHTAKPHPTNRITQKSPRRRAKAEKKMFAASISRHRKTVPTRLFQQPQQSPDCDRSSTRRDRPRPTGPRGTSSTPVGANTPAPPFAVKTTPNQLDFGSRAGFGLNARVGAARCLTDGPRPAKIVADVQPSGGCPFKLGMGLAVYLWQSRAYPQHRSFIEPAWERRGTTIIEARGTSWRTTSNAL